MLSRLMSPPRLAPPAAAVPPARGSGTHAFLLALALALAVVAALWPALRARAIALDDPSLVVSNALVHAPGPASVRRFFTEVLKPSSMSAYYMPLSMTSLMLDAAAGGSATNLTPFHVTSLVLHVLATVLLFLLLRRLTGGALVSALAALLYGVHPVMVEAVASAGERKTVLATALAFASTWAYVRAAQDRSARDRMASLAWFALALLAKPSVLALPVAFVVLDVWPLRRGWRAALPEKWPFALLAGGSAILSVLSVKYTWEFGAPPPLDVPLLAMKATWLVAFYLKQLAWPAQLSTVYAPPEPFTLTNPVVLTGVCSTLALAAVAWWQRHRAPALQAGLGVFVLLLAPTFSIIRFSPVIAYDRYVHLPALGLALAMAFALAALLRRRPAARVAIVGAALAVALAETLATRAALAPWSDSIALWERAVQVSPGAAAAHNGLGATWSERGEGARAITAFERAVQVDPGYGDGHQNLGRELTRAGRVAEALPHLELAARLSPGSPSAALQWALGFQSAGRYAESERQLRRALALQPDYALALAPLAVARMQQGDGPQAVALFRQSVAATDDPGARLGLAAALARTSGPSDEVVKLLASALQRRPDFAPAMNELAWLRATAPDAALRDTAQALDLSARAVALTGGRDPSLLDTRAAAEAAAGRFADAVATAERALGMARSGSDTALARGVASRLALYRRGKPWTDAGPRH